GDGTVAPAEMNNPSIAFDGDVNLVVWQERATNGDYVIRGAVMAISSQFVIASGPNLERPSVAAAGPGRFLVTYDIMEGGQHRIAGRFVDVSAPPPRRRAAR